jgi:hypothetical protein
MRLKKILDKEKGLTESRQNHYLCQEGKIGDLPTQHVIDDITSSEIMLVDDVNKVYEILKEVKKINNSATPRDAEWNKFGEVLRKWHSLSSENKDREYSENICSELNLFLKLRDESYF